MMQRDPYAPAKLHLAIARPTPKQRTPNPREFATRHHPLYPHAAR